MQKVAAVVVTYNRAELLKKQMKNVIEEQLQKVDCYYIIDNCSMDHTEQIVQEFYKNPQNVNIKYIKLGENTGGAGGFYHGIKAAYEDGFDWIILMDDDGRPYDAECFANLYKSIEEQSLNANQNVMINSLVLCSEEELSFGINYSRQIDDVLRMSQNGVIVNAINPFNGTLISRGLVKEIGYPNKDFFIMFDEVDYFRRAQKSDAIIYTCVNSKYYHPNPCTCSKLKVFGREVKFHSGAPWREYYKVRNNTYSYRALGMNTEAKLYLLLEFYGALKESEDKRQAFKYIIMGYRDGKKGKLGILYKA